MLMPKKTKYRKMQKGQMVAVASRGYTITYGRYALKALESERLTARQIEAARRAMTRYIKRGGKIWIMVFPDFPVTRKPAEVRMGSGKGALDRYVAKIGIGQIIFELDGVTEEIARESMRLAAMKLPVKTKFMIREVSGE